MKILLLQNSYKSLFDSLKQKFPFLPGMSVSVDIMTMEVANVLSVPIQSVTTREDTPSKGIHSDKSKDVTAEKKKKSDTKPNEVVFINNKGKVKAVKVTTGIQDDEYIEIKSGLKGDEEVVSGPFTAISRMLKDGDAVKVVDKSKLFKAETEKK